MTIAFARPGLATPDALFARVAARVSPSLAADALDVAAIPPFGDQSLNDWTIEPDFLSKARTAAVLVGLVARDDGVRVLLTQRTAGLRDHGGQIAFPGGKMDPGDASPAATALRETEEEIGLPGGRVDVLGYLGGYLTRTGFRIIPVVARIVPPFDLRLNPHEVVEAFEVPFAHVMDEANFRLETREWQGRARYFYAIEYGSRRIWGVTAGILRVLCDRLAA